LGIGYPIANDLLSIEWSLAVEFKPKRLTFEELSEQLREYEQKYGYSTIEFYRRFQSGELGDDDDLLMWSGLYHLYLTSLPVRQFMQREVASV
jgi:hypothetical protein